MSCKHIWMCCDTFTAAMSLQSMFNQISFNTSQLKLISFPCHCVQTGLGVRPAYYPMVTCWCFPGGKAAGL